MAKQADKFGSKEERLKKMMEAAEFRKAYDVQGLTQKQKATLYVYYRQFCNVARTCRAAGITRDTYYRWCNSSDTFKRVTAEIKEALFDDVESVMFRKAMVEKDNTLLIWISKTQMKERGYVETVTQNQNVNHRGTLVTSRLDHLSDEELDTELKRLEGRGNG